MKAIKFIGIILIIFVIILSSSILADQTLGLLGYPSAREIEITHPKNYHAKRSNIEYEVVFETNSKGLRYKDISMDNIDLETRFIVLGDSFVEGEGVQYGDIFTNLLESHFTSKYGKTFRFINAGLTNTGPLHYFRVLRYVGLQYAPDYILICIYANDVSDTPEHLSIQDLYRTRTHEYGSEGPALRRLVYQLLPRIYTLYGQFLDQIRDDAPNDFEEKVEYLARKNKISEEKIREWKEKTDSKLMEYAAVGKINPSLVSYPLLRPAYWTTGLDIATPVAKRKFETMSFILDEIVRLARSKRVQVGLVFIPAVWQYDPSAYNSGHPMVEGGMVSEAWLTKRTSVEEKLETWARSRSVPFLDLTEFFRRKVADGQALNYRMDLHWNPDGHAAAAEAIGSWLEMDILSQETLN